MAGQYDRQQLCDTLSWSINTNIKQVIFNKWGLMWRSKRQKLTEHPIHKSRLQLQAPRRSMITNNGGGRLIKQKQMWGAPLGSLCFSLAARALSSAFVLLDKHYSCRRILSEAASALKRRGSPLNRSLLLEWGWTHPPSVSLKRQEAAAFIKTSCVSRRATSVT